MNASAPSRLELTFWGVRGSIPTPVAENLGYGGNTACVTVRSPSSGLLIFDAGSGLRNLGDAFSGLHEAQPLSAHIFLTHFHWDHIHGIPFFKPLWHPGSTLTFHAARSVGSLGAMLRTQLSPPYFPIDLDEIPASCLTDTQDDAPVRSGDVTITSFPLNHPQHAVGYRIEADEAVIVYATDLEHGSALDAVLLEHAQGADVLIYDAQFTPEEYETYRGWGHSTWLAATEFAHQAGVSQLVLFHHSPTHSDDVLDAIVEEARAHFPNTIAAREGLTLRV